MLRRAVKVNVIHQLRYANASASAVTEPACYPDNFPKRTPIRPPLNKPNFNLVFRRTSADEWNKMGPHGLMGAYLQLAKHRLTLLITTTAVGGYLMSPASFSFSTLVACAAGTAFLSSAANACNQLLEAPYDAQMRRTQSRVLVVHRFSPLHALMFANVTTVAGLSILYTGCNSLTAMLGLLNLLLYAGVYTPLKRYHIGCTWAGAIVGAIPPLMGYTALTGTLDARSMVLAALLYCWQFPHFNGLSWNLRGDYSRAGYRVMCVTDENLCRKTTLRHALAMFGLCSVAAPLSNLTAIGFAFYSMPLNAAMLYFSYKFYQNPDAQSSRYLFRYSLLYLPLIMLLMVIGNVNYSDVSTKIVEKSSLNPLLPGMLKKVPSPVDISVRPTINF